MGQQVQIRQVYTIALRRDCGLRHHHEVLNPDKCERERRIVR